MKLKPSVFVAVAVAALGLGYAAARVSSSAKKRLPAWVPSRSQIRAGTKFVPAGVRGTFLVPDGTWTLQRVAQQANVPLAALQQVNPGITTLRTGQVITIPKVRLRTDVSRVV